MRLRSSTETPGGNLSAAIARPCPREEGLELFADDAVQEHLRRVVRLVSLLVSLRGRHRIGK